MRTIVILLFASLLPPQLPGSKQEPKPGDTIDRPVRIDKRKLYDDMQGPWKLAELRMANARGELRSDAGYCLVSGEYLSLELHVGWIGEDRSLISRNFQSGTHRFEINDTGQIETSTLIGSYISRDGDHVFERPGTARRYHASVVANRLTLTREDGQTLIFSRVFSTEPKRDLYGRERKEKPEKEPPKPDGG